MYSVHRFVKEVTHIPIVWLKLHACTVHTMVFGVCTIDSAIHMEFLRRMAAFYCTRKNALYRKTEFRCKYIETYLPEGSGICVFYLQNLISLMLLTAYVSDLTNKITVQRFGDNFFLL